MRTQVQELVKVIRDVHDSNTQYWVNMYWANRVTGKVNKGRPSGANTVGTVILNYACECKYATVSVLKEALRQSGDVSLERNRHAFIRSLTVDTEHRNADFVMKRVQGEGSSVFMFPSATLIETINSNVSDAIERERKHKDACKRLTGMRKQRTNIKLNELNKMKREVKLIAKSLGYKL